MPNTAMITAIRSSAVSRFRTWFRKVAYFSRNAVWSCTSTFGYASSVVSIVRWRDVTSASSSAFTRTIVSSCCVAFASYVAIEVAWSSSTPCSA
jgi:hypothetical protein